MSRFVKIDQEPKEDLHGGFWLKVKDDSTELFAKIWEPANSPPKAVVTFIHGIGEHILRYDAQFEKLAGSGIRVFAFDQRGFGRTVHRSRSVLGDGQGWNVVMRDIHDAYLFSHVEGVAHFIMGHSMGGMLALAYALEYGKQISPSGVIASAPALRPGFHVPYLKRAVGSFMARFIGSVNIPTEIDSNGISRDSAVVAAYMNDPYVHGMGSLRTCTAFVRGIKLSLVSGIMDKGEWILAEGYKQYAAEVPMLIAFGTLDKLTSFAAAKQFFEAVQCPDKTFRAWDGLYHEIHNEPEKDKVIQEYADWILARSKK